MSADECFLTSEQFFLSEEVFKSMTKSALCTNCNQHVGKHRKSAIIAETPTVVVAEKKVKRKRVTIADPPEVVLNPSNAIAATSSKDPKETDRKPSTPAAVADDGHLSISEDEESNDENDEADDDTTEITPHNPYLKKKKPRKVNNARDGKYGVGRDNNSPRRGGGRFTDGPGRGFGNRDRGGRGEGRGRGGGRGSNDSSRSVSGFDQQFGRPHTPQQHQSFPMQGSGHSFATQSRVSPFAQYSPQQMMHQQAHFLQMQMMAGQQPQSAPQQPLSQPEQPQVKVEAVSTVDQIVVPPPPSAPTTTTIDAPADPADSADPIAPTAPVVKKYKSMQPLPGIPVVPLSEILATAATVAAPIATASVVPVVNVDSLTPAPVPMPTVEGRLPLVLRAPVNTPTTATVSVIPIDSRSVTPEPEPRHQTATVTANNVHHTSAHTAETNAPAAVSTGSTSVVANVQPTSAVHADATPSTVVPVPRPPPPPGPRPVYNSFGNVAIGAIDSSRAQDGAGNVLKMSVLDKVQARQLQMQQHESLAQQLMPPPTALPSAFTVHPAVSAELARQQQMQQSQQTLVVSSGVGEGVENGVPVNCSML